MGDEEWSRPPLVRERKYGRNNRASDRRRNELSYHEDCGAYPCCGELWMVSILYRDKLTGSRSKQ